MFAKILKHGVRGMKRGVRKPVPSKKQPWQMTRDEFAVSVGHDPMELPITPLPYAEAKKYPITRDVDIAREAVIRNALSMRHPVPKEIISEYPNLKAKK